MNTVSYKPALILTLNLDPEAQAFFDRQRALYFPPERNYLSAHLTLFHQLPLDEKISEKLMGIELVRFKMAVAGLMNLGNGVAYRLESAQLINLQKELSSAFWHTLSAQDRSGFRPHVTIQNKVPAAIAAALLANLQKNFVSFEVEALGLDLWEYLGGPWRHHQFFPFR